VEGWRAAAAVVMVAAQLVSAARAQVVREGKLA